MLGGIILGGLIFGSGMAILGYCPGTMAISVGEGSLDAFIGILGGFIGGVVYTLILPVIQPILGPDYGAISLHTLVINKALFFIVVTVLGAIFIALAFYLQKIDKNNNKKWVFAGSALAALNLLVFSSDLTNRPIGASTTFPYLGDVIFGCTNHAYFSKIQMPGNWEMKFLAGAFLAGLLLSLIQKDFKIKLLHENWLKYKGHTKYKRVIAAFAGGFILIFGARMAGGCTSGHIVSGGMQLAVSSLTFAVFVFAGLLITGKLFYKKKQA